MPNLPTHPDLDQLRRQAKELLRDANAGDEQAVARIRAVSDSLTLAGAQLALARGYGCASWQELKHEVDTHLGPLAETVNAFLEASVGYRIGRAVRMLEQTPEIAQFSLATALVLGDEHRVREALEDDPGLAMRRDPSTGWAPLHAVCASRWHLDPARAAGLLAIAELLIERGADVDQQTSGRRSWLPLRCAVISAASGVNNEPIIRLLLKHGATPDDDTLYNAGWAADSPRLLRLLIEQGADVRAVAEQALAAPISSNNLAAARVLLDAGADPRRFRDDNGDPASVVPAALGAGCDLELIDLLLVRGADPDAPGPDGRSPYRMATSEGRADLVQVLRRHGARDDATDLDRLLDACRRGDRERAEQMRADDPGLLDGRSDGDSAAAAAAFVGAAEAGDAQAVLLMLDVGFPIDARAPGRGETALHVAAYSGAAGTVRLLLERGADLEARDRTWDGTALEWALVGSGERPNQAPAPDWVAAVAVLLDAGASTVGITLSPDDEKPPSAAVAQLLRERGVGGDG